METENTISLIVDDLTNEKLCSSLNKHFDSTQLQFHITESTKQGRSLIDLVQGISPSDIIIGGVLYDLLKHVFFLLKKEVFGESYVAIIHLEDNLKVEIPEELDERKMKEILKICQTIFKIKYIRFK